MDLLNRDQVLDDHIDRPALRILRRQHPRPQVDIKALAPDWHFTRSVGFHGDPAVDELGELAAREGHSISLGEPCEVGGALDERARDRPITSSIHTVTRRAVGREQDAARGIRAGRGGNRESQHREEQLRTR